MIKVADFGLSVDVYSRNYFREGQKAEEEEETIAKFPIRWMALESLNDGIFNEKTDVVSSYIIMSDISLVKVYIVVIWSDELGGVLSGQDPLSWGGSLLSHQISRERREIGQTSQ